MTGANEIDNGLPTPTDWTPLGVKPGSAQDVD